MPDISQFLELTKRREERDKSEHVHRLRTVLPQITEITEKARMVMDHEGWQLFVDLIETKVKVVEEKKAAHVQAMLFGPALGHDLERLKIELNAMDAEINALRYAQNLVPQILESGREVQQAAAASVAS